MSLTQAGLQEGSLSACIERAADLLGESPAAASALALEILRAVPGQQHALSLLACSKLVEGGSAQLCDSLQAAAAAHPELAAVQFELGIALAELGKTADAIAALSRVVALEPNHPLAWRALGDAHARLGHREAARSAYARHYTSAVKDLKLLEQALAPDCEDGVMAEAVLREYLAIYPTDVSAIYMQARSFMAKGRYEEAEELYARALERASGFTAARHNYALSLYHQSKAEDTLVQADILLRSDPENHEYRALKATALGLIGEYDQAIAWREALLRDDPDRATGWMKYGHLLRIQRRSDDAIAAYRRAITLQPGIGEAYWSLANLKTFCFAPEDIAAMQVQLGTGNISDEDRMLLHFALGSALESTRHYAQSFEHYTEGNRLRRAALSYDADQTTKQMRDAKRVFTRQFLRARGGSGDPSPDPIFIVGLPRSGSTLIEQILASHSAIEGTAELPDIVAMVNRLDRQARDGGGSTYPDLLGGLSAHQVRALGAEYLQRTQVHRKRGRPFFIDKAPANFRHIGFIQLILPNARIIDARRDPMACCFSNFKQYFASGVSFSFDLADIGRYYRDYVELMAHVDDVMPGRVHRVFYERMIADPESEIRRLLTYCNLPFEDACLDFHANERGVMTPSSEQVRKPIYTDALTQWGHFEPWLEPLKVALGTVLDAYPNVPAF